MTDDLMKETQAVWRGVRLPLLAEIEVSRSKGRLGPAAALTARNDQILGNALPD
ncbi:hypothetical protein [Inquilinus sp. Marseille-Q2685]|uniref:hypothetical protein n=1 Tax=Inquilinus sp. Marseille-Q2685 TaxID=2866581 RepID=UPI001CE44351|nr:hypothetical protein [Inquilinus sp. Marseille-Q2685]